MASSSEFTFAEKQLAKYGWKKGMGLGKSNNGMAEPLRVKRRCSNFGVGHDPSKAFTHWWDAAYNQTINNIHVSKAEDGSVTVSSSSDSSALKLPAPLMGSYSYGDFKKQGLLLGDDYRETSKKKSTEHGESSTRNGDTRPVDFTVSRDSDSSSSDDVAPTRIASRGLLLDMTDEQLLKLCGGRTLHKGARHGIRMSGKMKRLEAMAASDADLIERWGKQAQDARQQAKSGRSIIGAEVEVKHHNATDQKPKLQRSIGTNGINVYQKLELQRVNNNNGCLSGQLRQKYFCVGITNDKSQLNRRENSVSTQDTDDDDDGDDDDDADDVVDVRRIKKRAEIEFVYTDIMNTENTKQKQKIKQKDEETKGIHSVGFQQHEVTNSEVQLEKTTYKVNKKEKITCKDNVSEDFNLVIDEPKRKRTKVRSHDDILLSSPLKKKHKKKKKKKSKLKDRNKEN